MIKRSIAKFEKVSYEQFKKDFEKACCKEFCSTDKINDEYIKNLYDNIKLPKRATTGSAGYDFYLPTEKLVLDSFNEPDHCLYGSSVLIPTGIRVKITEGWFLGIFPRSGLGFKYRFQLDNTVAIIDSDYYNSSNEGHIMIKITLDKDNRQLTLSQGDAFVQGILLPYGITVDDETDGVRDGGFGSTSR